MGPIILKLELGQDFYTVHLPTKFLNPMFNRSEVIVLTNKQNTQTDEEILSKTSTSLRPATPVANEWRYASVMTDY